MCSYFTLTANEFKERYFNHPDFDFALKQYEFVSYQCYDHIWIAALALHCTAERMVLEGKKTQYVSFIAPR